MEIKEIPLTKKEIKELAGNKNFGLLGAILLLFIPSAYFIFSDSSVRSDEGYLFAVFFPLLFAFICWLNYTKAKKEIKPGLKKIITGTVTQKTVKVFYGAKSSAHICLELDHEYEFTEENNDLLDKAKFGQRTELHASVGTNRIFYVKNLFSGENNTLSKTTEIIETPLEDREIEKIKKEKEKKIRSKLVYIIPSAFFILPGVAAIFILMSVIALIFTITIAGLLALYIFSIIRSYNYDLRKRRKNITKYRMTDKFRANRLLNNDEPLESQTKYFYYLESDNKFFHVTEQTYYNCRPGDYFNVEEAVKSKVRLNIRLLKT